MKTTNIRQRLTADMIDGKIEGHYEINDALEPGVQFRHLGFIRLQDLGHNQERGYFDRRRWPEAPSDYTNERTDLIHPYDDDADDGWEAYVWETDGGNLSMLGERWQIADLYQALGEFLRGETPPAEEIDDYDTRWGYPYTIAEAALHCAIVWELSRQECMEILKWACESGKIKGARRDDTGRWFFGKRALQAYMRRPPFV